MTGTTFTPTGKTRFSSQCETILDMLKQGPVLRSSLVGVARNVTARISQLRNFGCEISCQRFNDEGETVYTLRGGAA